MATISKHYLVGWSIALLLSLVGVLAVARDQIFIGAAMSQASTLGIALAMWIGAWIAPATLPWFHSDEFLSAMAVAFSLGAALITGGWAATDRESHEAITGWVFLGSASLSILIVSHSPHGLEEIHRLLASSIIGATRTDVWGFSALAGLTALFLAVTHRRTLLFLMDPAMAAAVGCIPAGGPPSSLPCSVSPSGCPSDRQGCCIRSGVWCCPPSSQRTSVARSARCSWWPLWLPS